VRVGTNTKTVWAIFRKPQKSRRK